MECHMGKAAFKYKRSNKSNWMYTFNIHIEWCDGYFNESSTSVWSELSQNIESHAMLPPIFKLWWDNLAKIATDWVHPANIYSDIRCMTGSGQQLSLDLISAKMFGVITSLGFWFTLESSQPLKVVLAISALAFTWL